MISSNLEKKQIDLISESIAVYTLCVDVIDLHAKGRLTFSRMEDFVDDRGKSSLYRLKQMSHELFRNVDEATYREKFYDITVGYIFHEAMKLRENVYQLEYYKPQYETLVNSDELTALEKKIIHEFDALIHKAERRLKEGLKEVRVLLKDLVAQLKDLLKLYRSNYLLPRFILESQKALVKIYGKKGFAELLNEMYQYGRATLIYKAAQSYLESEYYACARMLFQKVVSMDHDDRRARFMFLYSSAFSSYFKNRLARALSSAEQALALAGTTGDVDTYARSLDQLRSDVLKELKKRGKLKEVHQYADLRV
jgi:tetratricopeptide (TPR) repeat protein